MPTPIPHYGIKTIVEQSLDAWFNANDDMLPGVELRAGQINEVRSLPIVIYYADEALGHPDLGGLPSGNFEVTVKIYVYSSADDAEDADEALALHRQRVQNVQAIMQDSEGLKDAWVAGKLYHLYFKTDDEGVDGRRFGNVLTYTMACVYPSA